MYPVKFITNCAPNLVPKLLPDIVPTFIPDVVAKYVPECVIDKIDNAFTVLNKKCYLIFKLNASTLAKKSDLEFLLLHIENHTQTEIASHWMDPTKRLLHVIFKSSRALRKLPISHYSIESTVKSIDNEMYFRRNEKIIILTNVTSENEKYLTIFIKNLVPNNNIIQYFESKMFSHTYFIEFQDNVNFEELESRQKNKPILSKQRFVLLPAYNTNCMLIRYNLTDDSDQRNDWCFNESGLCQKGPLIYVFKFKDYTASNSKLNGDTFEKFEQCFNLDLVSSKIGAVDDTLLLGIISSQKGLCNHFIEQYFPVFYLLFSCFMFFVELFMGFSSSKNSEEKQGLKT